MSRAALAERVADHVHAQWNRCPERATVLPALRAVARAVAGLPEPRDTTAGRALSDAQLEMLRLLAAGLERKQVYAKVGVGPVAGRSRLYEACRKLRAKNSHQAVAIAVAAGLITVEPAS